MKLKQLIKDIPVQQVKGSTDIWIAGLSANSKLVKPGYLFLAKKGSTDDGSRYIPEAVASGASAIVTDHYHPAFKNVVQLVHPEPALIEGILAATYYQFPSDHLWMVGITGTNGKTTTSFLVKYLLDQFYGPCGLIGTIEYIMGEHRFPATRTTPDVVSNHQMLRQMVDAGNQSAAMEVTSHALDQGRVNQIDFDVAIFTNLTLDHLDYHASMEDYGLAKSKLFKGLGKNSRQKKGTKYALVNADSPWTSKILEGCSVKPITYGMSAQADLRASQIELGPRGTNLKVTYQGKTVACHWPLIGRFNVYNCLAAMGAALVRGFSLEDITDKMAQLPSVRGRLEAVPNDLGLKIYVDFAHSDDALVNVLECLAELKTGRLITIFGCGGDRDKTKRPKMAEASERFSDLSIVTSDNPRSEDPVAICADIVKGFHRQDSYMIEIDRRQALQKALEMAQLDDIVLIAGKGHEPYQIFAHKTVEFDDCKIAADICSQLHRQRLACLGS